MKAQILSMGWHFWPSYGYLTLLLSDERLEFKHSYLRNPDPSVEVYGDKMVNHYRMTGSADPKFSDESIRKKWSGTDGPYKSNWNQTCVYIGGTSEAFLEVSDDYYGYMEPYIRRKFVVEGDYVISYTYDFGSGEWQFEGYQWPDEKYEFAVAKKVNGRWEIGEKPVWQNSVWLGEVSYTVSNPAPYYWLEFMNQHRPTINPGALSECIRNTIKEELELNMNNYANLIEIAGLIRDFRDLNVKKLVSGARKCFPDFSRSDFLLYPHKRARTLVRKGSKKLANGWLKYRYLYNTTKADVQEFARQVVNEKFGSQLTDETVLRGKINIAGGVLRCKMRLHENTGDLLLNIISNASKVGLFPGLYNVWDMIPFSFVADWFTDLGDYLEDLDQSFYFEHYKVDELLVSYKQRQYVDGAGFTAELEYYERELLEEFPQWEFYTDDSTASNKTICYRSLDAASLAVGVV